ncbi:hypothetical protein ACFUTV_03860 [Streptomyces sp. NPDC057298]|uniref:hypothetical protein n=1 Tax=Streptomyces sp. NPDC057298 TaxID=3346091 RepID=UPI003634A3E2
MEESRQSSTPGAAAFLRKAVPPPAFCGFLLLALIFTGAYAAGGSVGPVAPAMHGPGTSGSGAGEAEDTGNTGGMDGMHEEDR